MNSPSSLGVPEMHWPSTEQESPFIQADSLFPQGDPFPKSMDWHFPAPSQWSARGWQAEVVWSPQGVVSDLKTSVTHCPDWHEWASIHSVSSSPQGVLSGFICPVTHFPREHDEANMQGDSGWSPQGVPEKMQMKWTSLSKVYNHHGRSNQQNN